jgi:sulfoxide reductase heme-binding subunit YedZ
VRKLLANKWTKAVVFAASSIPFTLLAVGLLRNDLGINPVETLQHTTGDWTINFLVVTLAITPLRKTLNIPELIRYRRMLGLFAFFYVTLHFLTYLGPDQSFNFSGMWDDVAKRKFVTVGFAAFVLLIPLAVTSTSGMIRRLGGKRWQALHRLVYVCAILGVAHYYWLVKSDVRKPLFYGLLVGILSLWRVWDFYLRRKGSAPARQLDPVRLPQVNIGKD